MINLYNYQSRYLEGLPANCIMAASTGLGKSRLSLAHYQRYSAKLPVLVVAPASKVKTGDWHREFEMALGEDLPKYEVISYEFLTKDWQKYLDGDFVLILDEAHYICNATSKRSKAAQRLCARASQWICLTATPLPNGWRSAEAYAILTGLSRNKTAFQQQFVITDRSRGFPLVLGYREEPVLEQWWRTVAKPLERTGSLRLPSQSIGKLVTLPPKLAKTYERAQKERVYNGEMLESASKLFATLRQMVAPARIPAIQSIVEETNEHVVIFYNYDAEREVLLKMLEKKNRVIYEQSGHRSMLPPRNAWPDMPPSVTLAQYQSASHAIELTYASLTIFMSPCTSYSNYEQAIGRTLRHGQSKTALFYHLAIESSLDKRIWSILSKKEDFSTELIESWYKTIDNNYK